MRLRLEFAEARLARLEAEEKAESQNPSSNKADGEITRANPLPPQSPLLPVAEEACG